ncbi:sorbitol dehydrogenase [Xylariales sp. PMI_506]|nr:sorbitol dehydrogenase [Xylariales sp. PMI_506]
MDHPAKTRGQYLHGPKDFRLEDRDTAPLGPSEIQIAIRSTTICGSDLHYYSHFRNGAITVKEPLCLGHESAGEVIALGSEVSDLQKGDRVAVECGVPCGACSFCHSSRYNLCPSLRFRSSGSKFPHFQGTLQENINHPAKWVHKLPPELDYDIGALLEPLAVAVQAVRKVEQCTPPSARETCLVFGAGAIGLLCCLVARSAGWQRIIIADIDQQRLLFALDNGFATAAHLVKNSQDKVFPDAMAKARDDAEQMSKMTWPDGVPVGKVQATFECTGVQSCIQTSLYATSSGGSVVLVGLGKPNHEIPLFEAMTREINLIPTWRYADVYPRAIEIAVASVAGSGDQKLPDLRKLITHRYTGIDTIDEAFQTALATKDSKGVSVVKAVINF